MKVKVMGLEYYLHFAQGVISLSETSHLIQFLFVL